MEPRPAKLWRDETLAAGGLCDYPKGFAQCANRASTMADDQDSFSTTSVAADHLKQIIERIERLEEEKKEVAEQIKEVYAEAKGNGFDTKTLRKIVALRKKDPNERSEEEAMLDLYLAALGMLPAS